MYWHATRLFVVHTHLGGEIGEKHAEVVRFVNVPIEHRSGRRLIDRAMRRQCGDRCVLVGLQHVAQETERQGRERGQIL